MDYMKMAEKDFLKAAQLLDMYEESLESVWRKGYEYFINKLKDEEKEKMPETENMQTCLEESGNDELFTITIKQMWLDGYVSACSYYFEEKLGSGDFRRKEYKVYGCREELDKIEGGKMYTYVERVGDNKAEFWGVYEVQDDGMEDWLADFRQNNDAQMFALEKTKEEKK